MDIQLYNQIKSSIEYEKILNLGYKDITTPIQMKNGTLDFSFAPSNEQCDDRFSVYCDKIQNKKLDYHSDKKTPTPIMGVLRTYSLSYYGGLKMYKIKEFSIPPTYNGYINALIELEKFIRGRKRKYMDLLKIDPNKTIRILFTTNKEIKVIKDLYYAVKSSS